MYKIKENYYQKQISNIKGLSYIPKLNEICHNDFDFVVYDYNFDWNNRVEVSDSNLESLDIILSKIEINNIIEIGVNRNKEHSFTHKLISAKKGIYCGIDVEDKSSLNDINNQIYTIKSNSFDQDRIRNYFNLIGLNKCSVLFIDGWHSVNAVINDWMYTDLLEKNGVVIFHDTNYHPGPHLIIDAINTSIYLVEKYCIFDMDWGLSAAFKK